MAATALDIIDKYRTCEFTTISRDGSPQTWPVCPLLIEDGRFFLTTSIGFPQKAYNIRRNPKVSMLFSEPTASGVTQAAAVLIQGDATAADRIVTDMGSVPELARSLERFLARQPAGKLWSNWLGRRMFPGYYMRILIYVTPRRALFWPERDFGRAPEELDLEPLRNVD